MKIRKAINNDLSFLKEMLFEAFHWNREIDRPGFDDFLKNPVIENLLSGWGRSGDTAILAEVENKPVGAAWYRFW